MMSQDPVTTYIDQFKGEVHDRLVEMRKVISAAAPMSTEYFAYGMAGYKIKKPLIYFAAFEHHIGIYPGPDSVRAFADQLKAPYTWSKGTIRFPHNAPIPWDMVRQIVADKVEKLAPKA
jgi:uncharacterized protein YdhG (YjbR/CyaY superfamily)